LETVIPSSAATTRTPLSGPGSIFHYTYPTLCDIILSGCSEKPNNHSIVFLCMCSNMSGYIYCFFVLTYSSNLSLTSTIQSGSFFMA
jgi:hypothetical protein